MLAPLAAVILFLAAIIAAFGYLRLEEIDREQEAVKRDVEYTQQRLRLRLLERQEQLMRLARDVSNRDIDAEDFRDRAEALINQYSELESLSWIDDKKRIRSGFSTASLPIGQARPVGSFLRPGETETNFQLVKDLKQPVYFQRTVVDASSSCTFPSMTRRDLRVWYWPNTRSMDSTVMAYRPRFQRAMQSRSMMPKACDWPVPQFRHAIRLRLCCHGRRQNLYTKYRFRQLAMVWSSGRRPTELRWGSSEVACSGW